MIAKISFRIERHIKSFLDKKKLKDFITTKPVLYEMLKGPEEEEEEEEEKGGGGEGGEEEQQHKNMNGKMTINNYL